MSDASKPLQFALTHQAEIEDTQRTLVEYVPDRGIQIWLQRISRLIFIFFVSALVMMAICQANPALYAYVLAFFKWILIPIKPFVISSSPAHASGTLAFIAGIGQIFNWCMIPAVVYLAVRSMRDPFLIGIENGELVVVANPKGGNLRVEQSKTSTSLGPSYRLKDKGRRVSKRLSVAEIRNVTVVRPRGTRSVNDYLIVFEGEHSEIKVRWGDITSATGRETFLQSITRTFPDVNLTLLEPFRQLPQRQSFTELWLKELSGAPKRDKLTQLIDGTELEEGNYTVIRRAGIGGHGTVYFATSKKHSNQIVVLKEFVLPIYPDIRVRKSAAERFQAEANMLSSLNHPQIARFIELFIEDHRAYLVMELVEGETLKDLVAAQGPLPEAEVVRLALQICEIMKYLHEQEPPIIHRDLTPDNVMLAEDGLIKLIDFSVAEEVTSGVTGSVVGKPNYISPEQFRGKPTTASDIYSFGATLYYLLTGTDPPPITALHPQRTNDKLSDALDSIIAKCTQLKVDDRYISFTDVLVALQSLASK